MSSQKTPSAPKTVPPHLLSRIESEWQQMRAAAREPAPAPAPRG
jgi:hypothetical protein